MVGVIVGVMVTVGVIVGVTVSVGVMVGVTEGVTVTVGVTVGVSVGVTEGVTVTVGVTVGVIVTEGVGGIKPAPISAPLPLAILFVNDAKSSAFDLMLRSRSLKLGGVAILIFIFIYCKYSRFLSINYRYMAIAS